MPKVIKSSKRYTKKSNNRVKKIGKKHTRKNLKRICHRCRYKVEMI